MSRLLTILPLIASALPTFAIADDAQVVGVEILNKAGGWTFAVTIAHPDTGWDDYADGWRVVTDAGEVLGTRTLLHPHLNEQPFTRSLSGVTIPEGMTTVFIEARTNTLGWGAERYPVAVQD